jgi:hypothetical protein
MAVAIRTHGRFVRPESLPDAVWTALDRSKGFGYVVACDANGCNPAEVPKARERVMTRTNQARKAAAASKTAKPWIKPEEPSTVEDLSTQREWASGRHGEHMVNTGILGLLTAGEVCRWPRKE